MNRLIGGVEQTMPGDAASLIRKTLGEIVGVRALPAVLAWAGWRLVSRTTGRLAGQRRPPSRPRRAA